MCYACYDLAADLVVTAASGLDFHPDHLRQGIATQMFNHVQRNIEPRLRHSDQLTESGEAFARSMGHMAALSGSTLMVPLHMVQRHKIHNNTGRSGQGTRVMDDVDQEGMQSPVILDTDGRTGIIGDGSHRINIAEQLGLTHVPVKIRPQDAGYMRWAEGKPLHPALAQHLDGMLQSST